MTPRTLKHRHPSARDDIGILTTRRPLPGPALQNLDPFLFLNHHGPQLFPPGNRGLPFGPHPHRGFETVTFIVEGELAHKDSGGHESIISAGGVQWMTAGSGLVHAELSPDSFKRSGGPLEILQLWVNLPARLKMSPPRYTGLQREEIPQASLEGGRLNLIAGTFGATRGPVETLTNIVISTVELDAGASVILPAPSGRAVFLYVVRGEAAVGGEPVARYELIELNEDGDSVEIAASAPAILLYGHAEPFGEPIFAYGPFVMNTAEEIREAMADYQAGKFGPPIPA
jgi:redox-sensitive bicupin YhaK (pirin superfamily)